MEKLYKKKAITDQVKTEQTIHKQKYLEIVKTKQT